jgi:hypothetical protein
MCSSYAGGGADASGVGSGVGVSGASAAMNGDDGEVEKKRMAS